MENTLTYPITKAGPRNMADVINMVRNSSLLANQAGALRVRINLPKVSQDASQVYCLDTPRQVTEARGMRLRKVATQQLGVQFNQDDPPAIKAVVYKEVAVTPGTRLAANLKTSLNFSDASDDASPSKRHKTDPQGTPQPMDETLDCEL